MPSTRRPRVTRWIRMAVACGTLALVAAVLVAFEAVVFGVVSYGVLLVTGTTLATLLSDPPLALTLSVVAYVALVVLAVSAYRTATETPGGAVAPRFLGYVSAALVVGSFVVTYLVFDWLGVPRWVFGTAVVTAIALIYPVSAALLADDRSSDDDSPPWVVDDAEPVEESTAETLRLLAANARTHLGSVVRQVGVATSTLLAAAALVAVYAAGGRWPLSDLVPALAVLASLVLTGYHVLEVGTSELAESAVLRAFDGESPLAADERRDALQTRVDRLAVQADVPAPTVRLSASSTPTAAAVGYRPSDATLVVSAGLVDALGESELDAVLAHELAHVANYDAAVLTALSFPRAHARRLLRRYGTNPVLAVLAIVVAGTSRVCTAVVGRAREFAADDGAAAMTGDPAALASALETLDREIGVRPADDLRHSAAAAFAIVPPPWEEHRFFDRTRRFVSRRLLGTHPPTEQRVERLRARYRDQELT